jgi:hypothetical protein
MDLRQPPSTGKFVLPTAAVWLFLALSCGVVLSRIAAALESTFAPWLVFPLLLGLGLGAALLWLLRWCECGHRPTAILGTLLAAGLMVVAQHLWHYQHRIVAVQQLKQQILREGIQFAPLAAKLAPVPPTFLEFLEQEAGRGRTLWPGWTVRGVGVWLSWSLDAALLAGAAVAVVAVGVRRPYCNVCRTWYRLVWESPLDARRAAAGRQAGLLPETAGEGGRVCAWSCRGGCQPARVNLYWHERSAAGVRTNRRTVAWLSPARVLELAQASAALVPPAPPG